MEYFQKGNDELINKVKWGILSSRTSRPEITGLILDKIDTLDELEETLMSGWHSPIEKEIHLYLVHKSIPHIHVEAKGLPFVDCALGGEKVLFITHCSEKVNRIDRENALKRNKLVCELADKLIIPWLDPKGETFKMVRKVCDQKQVFVFDSEENGILLEAGAELFKGLKN